MQPFTLSRRSSWHTAASCLPTLCGGGTNKTFIFIVTMLADRLLASVALSAFQLRLSVPALKNCHQTR